MAPRAWHSIFRSATLFYRQGDFAFAEKRHGIPQRGAALASCNFLRTTDCFQFGLAALVVSYPDTSTAPDANGALSRCRYLHPQVERGVEASHRSLAHFDGTLAVCEWC